MIAYFDLTAWGQQLASILRMLWSSIIDILYVVGLIVAVITSIKLLLWWAARRRARREAHKQKYRPDGKPYPPFDEGMCDRCGRAFDKVYYMPSAERLCPDCYQASEQAPPAPAGADREEIGSPDKPP